jgi:hypothetical protein
VFVTTQAMRLELASRLVPGVDVWDAIEVELAVPFLLLVASIGDPNSGTVISRTFLAKPHHIADLDTSSDLHLSRVHLFSPPHLNEAGAWRLDPVSEVWECREPTDSALSWLFVLADGRLLADSMQHSPATDLLRHRRVYKQSDGQNPAGSGNHSNGQWRP